MRQFRKLNARPDSYTTDLHLRHMLYGGKVVGGKKKKKRQLQNNVSRTVAQTRFVELRRVRISYGKALLYSLHYSAVEFSTLIGHCNIIALY